MDEATLVEQTVTYMLEVNGTVVIIEHVPARVNVETGEQFFAPATVERLQQLVWQEHTPKRIIPTPVFDFAA